MYTKGFLPLFALLLSTWIDQSQCLPSSLHAREPITVPNKKPQTHVVQVVPPAIVGNHPNCTITLMPPWRFQNSWGTEKAFSTAYPGPPPGCPGPWSNVLLKLTIIGESNTFDRLGTIWLGNNLIWETSTAEPNNRITQSEYVKDLTQFSSLWRQNNVDFKFMLETDNSSPINATMTAIFIPGEPSEQPADIIYPISKGAPSMYSLPTDSKTAHVNFTSPTQSIEKATMEIFASGTSEEEFWQTNEDDKFKSQTGNTRGKGSYREVQFLIDGKVAGIYMPFQSVFSGGLNYLFWNNEVAIQTYDVPSYEVNLEPWLHVLADGKPHKLGFKVIGQFQTNNGWYVSGNLKIWKGVEGGKTTGRMIKYEVSALPDIDSTGGQNADGTFSTDVTVMRSLNITSEITLPSSPNSRKTAQWTQSMYFSNSKLYTPGSSLSVNALTIGTDTDSSGTVFSYSYPFHYGWKIENGKINSTIDHSWDWDAESSSNFAPLGFKGKMRTRQSGWATKPNKKGGYPDAGFMSQDMLFVSDGEGNGVKNYQRRLVADHTRFLEDKEVINGRQLRSSLVES